MKGAGGQAIPPPPPAAAKVIANDYNQHFVDTGERPQNFIRDYEPRVRFQEYPKLDRLIKLKDEAVRQRAHPSMHLSADLLQTPLEELLEGVKFDVILIDPPWREYTERAVALGQSPPSFCTLDELMSLRVQSVAEPQGAFCFLWCGSMHLDDGRALFQKWGFRRCEDVCWLKTNRAARPTGRGTVSSWSVPGMEPPLLQSTKEHCLVGVRGGVRRSADTHLVHANIDTDVIVAEEGCGAAPGDAAAATAKPAEIYEIIERFCLGRRKLELFGNDRNIRNGWVTVGRDIAFSNFDQKKYRDLVPDFAANAPAGATNMRFIATSPEIEALRPKSPTRARPTGDIGAAFG